MADRIRLFSSTREVIPQNFDADLHRLLEDPNNTGAVNIPPAGTSNGAFPPSDVSAGSPTEMGRGTRVTLPNFVTVENGRRYGIQHLFGARSTSVALTDAALLNDLIASIKELGFVVGIISAMRVGPGAASIGAGLKSRHVQGKALDIATINGKRATLDHPDYPNNADAIRMVQWFIQHGYTPEVNGGSVHGFIFGNGSFGWNRRSRRTGKLIPHHHHIHISIA